MVAKLTLHANLKAITDFPKFAKRFKEEVIVKGLDAPISSSVLELKKELKRVVNTQANQSQPASIINQTTAAPVNTNPLLSKSKEDILQYLTGADLNKHNPSDNYNISDGSNILSAQYNKQSGDPNRMDIRISINPYESIEEHYTRALSIFQSSVFAIPNNKGELDLFINAGEDLTDVTKIDCSTLTGTTDIEPDFGMSPNRRFERDKRSKGYATWTLKQNFVKRIRQNQTKFINLNPVIENIQEGNFDEAKLYLNRVRPSSEINNLVDKVDNLAQGKDVPENVQGYLNILRLINTIKIHKRVTDTTITYTLVSLDADTETSKKFLDEVRTALVLWSASNADKWFKEMVKVTTKLIREFEGR